MRTGKRLWIFHTIPTPGEFGQRHVGEGLLVVLGQRGRVGAVLRRRRARHRLPAGRTVHRRLLRRTSARQQSVHARSLVAVDLNTGKRIWHYQLVHHGVWDYDIPCAPILADITVDGKRIKAVAQPTKQGFVYVFDRNRTARLADRRAARRAVTVPGERLSPTQPFPTKPPPFELQGVQEKDLIDFTPEIKKEALKVASQFKLGPLFTPPIVRGEGGKIGMVFVPTGRTGRAARTIPTPGSCTCSRTRSHG